jgi:hypothetical protein
MGHSKYTKNGCTVVRLTADDDVNSIKGQQKALDAIKDANTDLWIAIPCTGGSPWMKVLASHPNGRKKIKAHVFSEDFGVPCNLLQKKFIKLVVL